MIIRYYAPEVANGLPYNHKSDVFSFAIILCHLMNGYHPVPNSMDEKMHRTDVMGASSWRPVLNSKWPLELKRLIARSWNKDVQVRPNFLEILPELESMARKYKTWEDIYNLQ